MFLLVAFSRGHILSSRDNEIPRMRLDRRKSSLADATSSTHMPFHSTLEPDNEHPYWTR
jgi:hypothetical protein